MKKAITGAALLGLVLASPVFAQGPAIEINAFGGLYLPVTDLVDAEDPFGEGAAISNAAAAMFGGRVSVWVTEMFGIEGGFGYALSDLELDVDGTDVCDDADAICDANVWMGSLKGLYRIKPMPDANWAIHLGAGAAVIGRGGDALDGVDGKTDIGGVLNVGVCVDVTPQVAIRLDVEDYLYSAKFDVDGDESDAKFQNDLGITGGVAIKLGGSGGMGGM